MGVVPHSAYAYTYHQTMPPTLYWGTFMRLKQEGITVKPLICEHLPPPNVNTI